MFSARVLADSIAPNGVRLTTMEVTLPRIVLAEFNTHRMFSRNSASSRAIPIERLIKRVLEDPFKPVYWGRNQKGMQAAVELTGWRRWVAEKTWIGLSRVAIAGARLLSKVEAHKQIANRLLEPWLWQTIIVTASEWDNFFALRCHPAAQPEIRVAAEMMRDALKASTPRYIPWGGWHMPLMDDYDELAKTYSIEEILLICVGRCARISYLTHTGVRDPKEDIRLAMDLTAAGHMSPLEHVAAPAHDDAFYGNFKGWIQKRKLVPYEHNYGARKEAAA